MIYNIKVTWVVIEGDAAGPAPDPAHNQRETG